MTLLVFISLSISFVAILKVSTMNGVTSMLEKLGVSIIGASSLVYAVEEVQGVISHLSITGLLCGSGLLIVQSVVHGYMLKRYERQHNMPNWIAILVGRRHSQ